MTYGAIRRYGLGDTCDDAAQQQTASLDASITDLAKNWHPTGLYTPNEVTQIVQKTLELSMQATSAILKMPYQSEYDRVSINTAANSCMNHAADAQKYNAAVAAVTGQGNALIRANDLKDWVVKSMLAASNAFMVVATINCNIESSGWKDLLDVIGWFQSKFDAVKNFLFKIVGAIADAIHTILEVPSKAAEALNYALKISLVAGGLYVAYELFWKDKHKPKRNPARRRRR